MESGQTMNTVPITLVFADGVARRIDGRPGDSLVQAAADAGLGLLTDCSNGRCGTCAGQLISGALDMNDYDKAVLPDSDRQDGAILACVSRITQPCAIEFPYDSTEALADEAPPIEGRVAALEKVAAETVMLQVDIDRDVHFEPGQYVRMRPQGAQDWRSYSMACVSGTRRLVFYIRVVDGGRFSTWLVSQAQVGARLELTEPHGSFFLRDEDRPRLFIAGGTGLAPFLSMLESIARDPRRQAIPTTLLVGVRTGAHLFAIDQLQRLRERWPALAVHYAAECDPAEGCHNGYATELVSSVQAPPETRVYLCGPPAMVEAGRSAAEAAGLPRRDMLCERFT
jgi:3-phenylpropionate/trans-cinnamate dioxygenase ferredoxin reductase subunit